jgi:hypothetical protein
VSETTEESSELNGKLKMESRKLGDQVIRIMEN